MKVSHTYHLKINLEDERTVYSFILKAEFDLSLPMFPIAKMPQGKIV